MEEQAFAALLEAVARHTVAIVPRQAAWLGSGVCVSYEGNHFIATAAHLVKGEPLRDLYLSVKAPGPLQIMRKTARASSTDRFPRGQRFHPRFDSAITSEKNDVALLHIARVPGEMRDVYFYDLKRTLPRDGVKDAVLVLGFPSEMLRGTTGQICRTISTHIEPTRISKTKLKADDYDPKSQLLLDFSS